MTNQASDPRLTKPNVNGDVLVFHPLLDVPVRPEHLIDTRLHECRMSEKAETIQE